MLSTKEPHFHVMNVVIKLVISTALKDTRTLCIEGSDLLVSFVIQHSTQLMAWAIMWNQDMKMWDINVPNVKQCVLPRGIFKTSHTCSTWGSQIWVRSMWIKGCMESNLATHKLTRHDCVRYTCDVCQAQLSTPKTLLQHKRSINEGKRVTCDQCDHQTTTERYQRRHKLLQHVNKNCQTQLSYCGTNVKNRFKILLSLA